MSKITNDGLTRSGTGCFFIAVLLECTYVQSVIGALQMISYDVNIHVATVGVKGLKEQCRLLIEPDRRGFRHGTLLYRIPWFR